MNCHWTPLPWNLFIPSTYVEGLLFFWHAWPVRGAAGRAGWGTAAAAAAAPVVLKQILKILIATKIQDPKFGINILVARNIQTLVDHKKDNN